MQPNAMKAVSNVFLPQAQPQHFLQMPPTQPTLKPKTQKHKVERLTFYNDDGTPLNLDDIASKTRKPVASTNVAPNMEVSQSVCDDILQIAL